MIVEKVALGKEKGLQLGSIAAGGMRAEYMNPSFPVSR